ncbi:MAG: MlaE family lipid ABC transporter permease subunit [Candidatus Sumerlaeota bacterium]|nr:MlaE family lipid ABC transporter permease subunit [Candidatus Sumerlaeota bacterium]
MRLIIEPVIYFTSSVGGKCLQTVRELGRIALFFLSAFGKLFYAPWGILRILQQVHFIGAKSLLVVGLTGLFAGMVLGLQGYYTLVKLGSESLVGAVVALSLIRELGPVLTALMVTGRAGSSITAELGIMRITEQIDALETMNIDPIKFLISPRLFASLICFPLLTAVFDVVGIAGGYLTGVMLLGVNSGTYLRHMESSVEMKDVSGGFIKSVIFAIIVCIICCYLGHHVQRRKEFGARGVSFATTAAVVTSSVLILVFDYVLTSFLL